MRMAISHQFFFSMTKKINKLLAPIEDCRVWMPSLRNLPGLVAPVTTGARESHLLVLYLAKFSRALSSLQMTTKNFLVVKKFICS